MHGIGPSLHLPVAVIPPRVIPLLLEWTIVTVQVRWMASISYVYVMFINFSTSRLHHKKAEDPVRRTDCRH